MWSRPSTGVIGDISGYISGRVFGLAIAAITGVVVARYLGPADLGLLGFAVSIYSLAIPIALLGMRSVLVREFSTSDNWQAVLASAVRRQLTVAVVTSIVGFLVIVTSTGFEHSATLIAFALLPLPVLAIKDSYEALHESFSHVRVVVVVGLASALLASTGKVLAVVMGSAVWVFAALTTVEALLIFVGLSVGARRTLGPLRIRASFDAKRARALVKESWPLLIAGFAVTVYVRIDVAMLGLLADDASTGLYVAAARISEIWYFVPIAAMAAVRPRLARAFANGDFDRYKARTQQFMSAMWGVSLAAVVMTVLLGGILIVILYGDAFSDAQQVLQIHILAAPFVFLGVAGNQWFIDQGLTREVMVRSVAGAVVNIVANIVLIPMYGPTGAAVATLMSYATASVLLNALSRRTRPVFLMQLRAMIFTRT